MYFAFVMMLMDKCCCFAGVSHDLHWPNAKLFQALGYVDLHMKCIHAFFFLFYVDCMHFWWWNLILQFIHFILREHLFYEKLHYHHHNYYY